jgi:hypothetical protein
MSAAYLSQFLINQSKAEYGISQLTPNDILPTDYEVSIATVPFFDTFAQIYYCSDGFDLGAAPKFSASSGRSYEQDAIIATVSTMLAIVRLGRLPSLEDRARLVHDALSRNYLYWVVHGKAAGRHHLIVPFDALPPYEKKKRYFAAEVSITIIMSQPTDETHERFIASQMVDLATYHTAYELLRNHADPVAEPNALIEAFDGDFMSASTLH